MTHSTVTPAILGLDLGDRTSHLCALDDERQVVERSRFKTTPQGVRETFERRARTRVVLEAGSQSRWISAQLKELGFEVQVADPRRVSLIAKGHRKTDQRDAEVLARLALGMPELLGEVHHRSSEQQSALALLRSRDLLVRVRTRMILHVRGTCKAFGLRLASAGPTTFHKKLLCQIPSELLPALEPLFTSLAAIEGQIRELDHRLRSLVKERYQKADWLMQVNGVGPITSLAYLLTVGDASRFRDGRTVGSWVGLTPRVRSSGQSNPQLSISKTGDAYLRRLLVQSAQYILGPFGQDCDLRRFGERLVARGGKGAKRRAVVAVARKLSVLLHALWRSGEPYDPLRTAKRLEATSATA